MKFPLPADTFPTLVISPEDKRTIKAVAEAVVRRAVPRALDVTQGRGVKKKKDHAVSPSILPVCICSTKRENATTCTRRLRRTVTRNSRPFIAIICISIATIITATTPETLPIWLSHVGDLLRMGNIVRKKNSKTHMGGDVTSVQQRRKVTLPPGYSQLHWVRLTQSGQDLSGLRGAPPRRSIPMAEVNQHNTEDDCWSVLDGKVYNLTPYMRYHPGGIPYLMMSAGGDCTDLFKEYHPWVNARGMLDKCYIGELDPDSVGSSAGGAAAAASKFALDVNEWREFKLLSKQIVSEMTVKFTFELPSKKYLGLEIPGQHLKIRATINGKVIERAYTPSSKFTQIGSFDLLVKVYPDGVMSSYLDSLEAGAKVEIRGPHGVIGYPSPGKITHGKNSQDASHLVLLAGGSGITPMLQLIRAAFESTSDTTHITLLYSNRSLEHIIALDQLEPLANIYPGRFQLHHLLSSGSARDKSALGSSFVGKLDKELLQQFLPEPAPSIAVFLCGPPKYEDAMSLYLQELGFQENQIYVF